MSMKQTTDFLLYLNEQVQKEELRDIWLAKDTELSLNEFISQNTKKRSLKTQSIKKDEEVIAWAEMILNSDTKGDADGAI